MSQSGAHQSTTCQKGVKSCPKGVLPKLRRDDGVYPRASFPKRGTWSHPTFDHSRSPARHSRKKTKLWMVARSPGSMTNAADFDLASISRRTWTSPSAKAVPLFVQGSGGVTLFSNAQKKSTANAVRRSLMQLLRSLTTSRRLSRSSFPHLLVLA